MSQLIKLANYVGFYFTSPSSSNYEELNKVKNHQDKMNESQETSDESKSKLLIILVPLIVQMTKSLGLKKID